jgi:hypothetical protein
MGFLMRYLIGVSLVLCAWPYASLGQEFLGHRQAVLTHTIRVVVRSMEYDLPLGRPLVNVACEYHSELLGADKAVAHFRTDDEGIGEFVACTRVSDYVLSEGSVTRFHYPHGRLFVIRDNERIEVQDRLIRLTAKAVATYLYDSP